MNGNYTSSTIKLIVTFLFSVALSCKKFVEVPVPSYQLIDDRVFSNDSTSNAAIVGIYSRMMESENFFTASSMTTYPGMYADELSPTESGGIKEEFFYSRITARSHDFISTYFWQPAYQYIYVANMAIEKLETSNRISEGVKRMLLGEARFIRAFCYFYLVNLFGDIPLVLKTSYLENMGMPRANENLIYEQIVIDLKKAKDLLPDENNNTKKARPNKYAAVSLLARVYLYKKEWEKAFEEASIVIKSNKYQLQPELNKVFISDSPETIWQLLPVNSNWNTWEGKIFLPYNDNVVPAYSLSKTLLGSFHINDQRRKIWVSAKDINDSIFCYPSKYIIYGKDQQLKEYNIVLRLAELFLIRAEASFGLGRSDLALNDLNIIRARAGLSLSNEKTDEGLLMLIEEERRHELFAEWGHRWLDLKRWDKANSVIQLVKPTTWKREYYLWPIPQIEIQLNPSLIQNPGY